MTGCLGASWPEDFTLAGREGAVRREPGISAAGRRARGAEGACGPVSLRKWLRPKGRERKMRDERGGGNSGPCRRSERPVWERGGGLGQFLKNRLSSLISGASD